MKNLCCAVEKAEMPRAVGAELNTGGIHVTALGLALAPRPTWVGTVTVSPPQTAIRPRIAPRNIPSGCLLRAAALTPSLLRFTDSQGRSRLIGILLMEIQNLLVLAFQVGR